MKFYTDEGNFDLVGNNIPVFFIQDAMKFPDLVHAVKPEPHHGMPQAASAHDTFWDFVSLMPESTHMLMWVMSDRSDSVSEPSDAGLRLVVKAFRAWRSTRRFDAEFLSNSTRNPVAARRTPCPGRKRP